MTIKEKVEDKEKNIRMMLNQLRDNLNGRRLVYNNNKNDWFYLSALSHTESKLKEVIEFFADHNG